MNSPSSPILSLISLRMSFADQYYSAEQCAAQLPIGVLFYCYIHTMSWTYCQPSYDRRNDHTVQCQGCHTACVLAMFNYYADRPKLELLNGSLSSIPSDIIIQYLPIECAKVDSITPMQIVAVCVASGQCLSQSQNWLSPPCERVRCFFIIPMLPTRNQISLSCNRRNQRVFQKLKFEVCFIPEGLN